MMTTVTLQNLKLKFNLCMEREMTNCTMRQVELNIIV
jgi:hypothetical protein